MNKIKYDTYPIVDMIRKKFKTQKAFAEKIGWTDAMVSNVLNNNSGLTRDNILLWADALDLGIDDIGAYFFVV